MWILEKRLFVLLVIGFVLLYSVWHGIMRPSYDGLMSYRTLIGQTQMLLGLYDSIIIDERFQDVPSASTVISNSGFFWKNQTFMEASEALHSAIKKIADHQPVTLLSISVKQPKTLRGGRITQFSFIITYEVQTEKFGSLVYAVESSRPSIFIEWIEVSSQDDSLVVQMEICGLTWAL